MGRRWDVGIHVYAAGAILLGLIGLSSDDFAAVWQPVPPGIAYRKALAYVAAVLFISAGTAVQSRRFARAALIVLSILYFVFSLLWLRRVIGFPQIWGTWGGFFEQMTLVVAALILFAAMMAKDTGLRGSVWRVIFGICVVSFALDHFLALPETTRMVPAWIPPGQRFWAVATGIFHLLAGLAIISGVMAGLASRLFTAMLVGFGVLLWLPALIAAPRDHFTWCANAINLALTGAAWAVSDWIVRRERSAGTVPSRTIDVGQEAA